MTTIYFVRHGEYVNPNHINPLRLSGFPLSPSGRKQITELGNYFKNKNISAIYTSPILRTKQTADAIGKILKIKPKVSQELTEMSSPFQGYDRSYLDNVIKNIYRHKFHQENGGESVEDIYKRMRKFTYSVINKNKGKRIIAVSHGDPIMIFTLGEKKLKFKEIEEKVSIESPDQDYIPMGGVIKFTWPLQE